MLVREYSTKIMLGGHHVDKNSRFRLDLVSVVEGPLGFEASAGFLVDEKWPAIEHLSAERIPVELRLRRDQLNQPLFVSDVLSEIFRQAKETGRVIINTQVNPA
jgi:hypothetical protein